MTSMYNNIYHDNPFKIYKNQTQCWHNSSEISNILLLCQDEYNPWFLFVKSLFATVFKQQKI